ncbi:MULTISPECIES: hypothetical protein [unclassified Nocardia]|uniref:hypothetical protein n=1 Tax=unclassified Nocardia TaxID=2637762 RepID=UPI00278BD030|nr:MULTISPECIES: hypothetical protein [unclassified Nocardia]
MEVLRSANLLWATAEELAAIGIQVLRGMVGPLEVRRQPNGLLMTQIGRLEIHPERIRAMPCSNASERDEAILFGDASLMLRKLWASPIPDGESVRRCAVWRAALPHEKPGIICPGIRRLHRGCQSSVW